jgi:PAS domain S-box-containing protein
LTDNSIEGLRQSALQTASAILSLQRKADEEIRALNQALRQRTEELAAVNAELLRQSETAREHMRDAEVFRTAFESFGSGKLLLATDGRILRVNAAFCEFIGRSREALCAMTIEDVTPTEELAATRESMRQMLSGELPRVYREMQYRHASGRLVWGAVSAAVVRDAAGEPLFFVAQVQDINGRKLAEAETRRLEVQLLQMQKMDALGTLAGGVAHDFNNVLAAILSHAEVMQLCVESEEQVTEAAREITAAAARGAELVRQILTFSRRSERRLAPVRLGSVLKQSLRMLRAALPASIEIRSVLPETGPMTMADPTQIQQVITNLATNAWHAMEAGGGTLSVELSHVHLDAAGAQPDLKEGLHARIRVSDDGEGIDEETLRHIFEPFFTTKPPGKGTGLGLSVVYGIVRDHGGAIRVTSRRGHGTTFEILLPSVPEQSVSPTAPGRGARPGTGQRVLVVDDEPALVQGMSRLLGLFGYAVHGTSRPEEALALCAAERFDLAILDFNMPGLNGVELARRLHAAFPRLPILLMSGYFAPEVACELDEIGVRDVLQKPITGAALAEKVGLALAAAAAAP